MLYQVSELLASFFCFYNFIKCQLRMRCLKYNYNEKNCNFFPGVFFLQIRLNFKQNDTQAAANIIQGWSQNSNFHQRRCQCHPLLLIHFFKIRSLLQFSPYKENISQISSKYVMIHDFLQDTDWRCIVIVKVEFCYQIYAGVSNL